MSRVYEDTSYNRRLGRVGQPFGSRRRGGSNEQGSGGDSSGLKDLWTTNNLAWLAGHVDPAMMCYILGGVYIRLLELSFFLELFGVFILYNRALFGEWAAPIMNEHRVVAAGRLFQSIGFSIFTSCLYFFFIVWSARHTDNGRRWNDIPYKLMAATIGLVFGIAFGLNLLLEKLLEVEGL